ncbi:MAG TPA: flagellar filament capping protein FliD [Alcaligenaceae bacterium]|nr:flagellar filament capping protein FliD [Alcaligenaceae bacterium]
MAISSIGVGSGLPLDQLLTDLRKAESQPLQLIKQRQVISEARLSGYGIIKGALTDLQKSAQALGKTETYGALKATSSSDALGVKVENKAVAGNYNVQVSQLATQQSLVLAGRASRDTPIGSGGTIEITLENGESHSIELGSDTSLQGVMKAINADPKAGVQATMINDGDATAPYRLMLTAKDTGSEASVARINVIENDDLAAVLGFNNLEENGVVSSSGTYSVSDAQNAKLTLNSIEIESQSNSIKDVIEGVTLDLKSMPKDGETVKIAVARDDSAAINGIKDFVKSYNSLLDTIKTQTSFDVDAGQSSALTGDSLIRRIENQMRNVLNGAPGSNTINTLADLGITTDYKTGKLEINDDKLTEAVKNNLNEVTNFLSGENGLAKRVDSTTNEFIKSGGLISNSTDSIERNIRMLKDQYEVTSERIDGKMENYRKQFSQLDVMVNQMNGTSQYLAQQLDMLANMNAPKK